MAYPKIARGSSGQAEFARYEYSLVTCATADPVGCWIIYNTHGMITEYLPPDYNDNGWGVTADGIVSVPISAQLDDNYSALYYAKMVRQSDDDESCIYTYIEYKFQVVCMTVELIVIIQEVGDGTYIFSCTANAQGGTPPYTYSWSTFGTLVSGQGTPDAVISFSPGDNLFGSISVSDSGSPPCYASADFSSETTTVIGPGGKPCAL